MKKYPEVPAASRPGWSRRRFLTFPLLATAAVVAPRVLSAATPLSVPREKRLSFYNIHTGESLSTVYWINGGYLPEALQQIDYILRDYRLDRVKSMNPKLLDLLYELHRRLDTTQPYHIICGYRSPQTNAFLHRTTRGVAVHSQHVLGNATDLRVPGRNLTRVRSTALGMHEGGVGYYPHSDFVHVDVGRVRQWELALGLHPQGDGSAC